MSDPVVTLTPDQVSVPANGQVGVVVTVRNVSAVVEGYRLELLAQDPTDGPALWGEVQPAELRVYPEDQATATVTFAPPAGALAPSGRFAFGVRVRSVVDPESSTVAEGDVEVGQVLGLQAKLVPVTSSGRWRGRHVVRFTNWGNTSTRLHVTVTDPDDKLGFLPAETDLDLPLGATADLKLKVRVRRPFLRGMPVRLPFQIVGEPVGGPPTGGVPRPVLPGDPGRPVVDGAMTQKPILTKLTVAVAVLVLAGAAGLGAYVWKKPSPLRTYESEGAPARPSPSISVRPDGALQVTWAAIDQVEKYRVAGTQGTLGIGGTDVAADKQIYISTGLSPNTKYCFTVQSVRGSLVSAPSKQVCATTSPPVVSTTAAPSSVAATPTPSADATSGSGSGGGPGGGSAGGSTPVSPPASTGSTVPPPPYDNGKVTVKVDQVNGAADDPAIAKQAYDKYLVDSTAGQTLYLIHTSMYPQMAYGSLRITQPAWLMVTIAFDTPQNAQAFCDSQRLPQCVILTPGPRVDVTAGGSATPSR